jgi:hypothetical protein
VAATDRTGLVDFPGARDEADLFDAVDRATLVMVRKVAADSNGTEYFPG